MAERNYDFTEIKTRIIIRNDSAENWAGSEVILEKGEPAIEYDAVNKTAKIKFGDGTSTFSELPFSTLTPSEVNDLIDAIDAGGAQITTVTTSGDGNAVTGGSISDDGTTLTLTKGTEFVPASGGIFSGDVTVSDNLTADSIKTNGEITFSTSENVDIEKLQQTAHDTSKIIFYNSNSNEYTEDSTASISFGYEPSWGGPTVNPFIVEDTSFLDMEMDKITIKGDLVANTINNFMMTTDEEQDGYSPMVVQKIQTGKSNIAFSSRNPEPNRYIYTVTINSDNINLNAPVTLAGAPTTDLNAATKKYVDDSVSSITVDSLTNGTKTLILNGGSATE